MRSSAWTPLIPKTDKVRSPSLVSAMNAVISTKWPNKVPSGLNKPLHDGDGEKPNGGEYGEECQGHWVFNVKSNRRPGIIDANMQDVIDPNEFVSGDYCRQPRRLCLRQQLKKGASFGLNNIQVLTKGDPRGARASAQDEFSPAGKSDAAFEDDNPF